MKTKPNSHPIPFAHRMDRIPKSFIREILKTAASPNVISFAGGLPDETLMPVEALERAFHMAVEKNGRKIFQYTTTEGLLPLRAWIASRYRWQFGLPLSAENILITNGAQQGIDLLGKVLIEKDDRVIVEQPAYLGTLQSLSVFEPKFVGVPIDEEGIRQTELVPALEQPVKMIYLIPNFQNPSGISYSRENRVLTAEKILVQNGILVEDDPYYELCFDTGSMCPPIMKWMEGRSVLLGSFSKTLSPALRVGWIVAGSELMEKLVIAKQAADLHTNSLAQAMVYEYLMANDFEKHLDTIRSTYRERKEWMIDAIRRHMPREFAFTNPGGGMFVWGKLPSHLSAIELVQWTMDQGVVMVPGTVFYADGHGDHEIRLNFSRSNRADIDKGVRLVAKGIEFLNSKDKQYMNTR